MLEVNDYQNPLAFFLTHNLFNQQALLCLMKGGETLSTQTPTPVGSQAAINCPNVPKPRTPILFFGGLDGFKGRALW